MKRKETNNLWQNLKCFRPGWYSTEKQTQCSKEFGNVTVQIVVIPSNNLLQSSPDDLFRRAFYYNDAVTSVEITKDIPGFPCLTYVIFAKEVVQYFTDNLGDYYGITSTLYQDIAKDIFVNTEGVYFCTDVASRPRPLSNCGSDCMSF